MIDGIVIENPNLIGQVANILFNPLGTELVFNLGNHVIPYFFDPSTVNPPQSIYGTYSIFVEGICIDFLNVLPPTPTPTPTVTLTKTPTNTPTTTITPTPTFDPCKVPSQTPTETPTQTPTITQTITPTVTPTWNLCITPLPTQTPTETPNETPSQTPSANSPFPSNANSTPTRIFVKKLF